MEADNDGGPGEGRGEQRRGWTLPNFLALVSVSTSGLQLEMIIQAKWKDLSLKPHVNTFRIENYVNIKH